MSAHSYFRRLPAMGQLMDSPALRGVIGLYGRDSVRVQARLELDRLRGELSTAQGAATGSGIHPEGDQPHGGQSRSEPRSDHALQRRIDELPRRICQALDRQLGGRLQRVINATGIFVHTNLGRAPLPEQVVEEEVLPLLSGYCDLEVDLESGKRSDRNRRIGPLMGNLCGVESAIVTNNNAAALVLALTTHAQGREVIVSRGELVEIGGSFRVPDILEAAGARLVEVGTTNRTRIGDYREAIGESTAMLLKVHPSNYRIRGFTEQVDAAALARLGRETGRLTLVDEGSGLLMPDERPQLRDHPSFRELTEAGIDLICGSGDKLLGGPQAGLLAGRAALVAQCRRHPLYRALRPDRMTFLALEAVLRRRLAGLPMPLDRLWDHGPSLKSRLEALASSLGAKIVPSPAFVGGGSAPDAEIPGHALCFEGEDGLHALLRHPLAEPPSAPSGADTGDLAAASRDRRGSTVPPVMGFRRDGHLLLDLRTVAPEDDPLIEAAIALARSRSLRGETGRPDRDPKKPDA